MPFGAAVRQPRAPPNALPLPAGKRLGRLVSRAHARVPSGRVRKSWTGRSRRGLPAALRPGAAAALPPHSVPDTLGDVPVQPRACSLSDGRRRPVQARARTVASAATEQPQALPVRRAQGAPGPLRVSHSRRGGPELRGAGRRAARAESGRPRERREPGPPLSDLRDRLRLAQGSELAAAGATRNPPAGSARTQSPLPHAAVSLASRCRRPGSCRPLGCREREVPAQLLKPLRETARRIRQSGHARRMHRPCTAPYEGRGALHLARTGPHCSFREAGQQALL